MIHIIDYGMGNISSIQNMLKKVGAKSVITSNPNEIVSAEKIILPGVGSFDTGMKGLHDRGWTEVLNKKVLVEKIIVLGVCLGIQLMCRGSEEGNEKGLGWIDADVVRFKPENAIEKIRVPHMGWNSIEQKKNIGLLSMNEEQRFYFVHSYHLQNVNEKFVWAVTGYGYEFVSAVHHENFYGVQFHPEKSHRYGMEFFKNFASLKS